MYVGGRETILQEGAEYGQDHHDEETEREQRVLRPTYGDVHNFNGAGDQNKSSARMCVFGAHTGELCDCSGTVGIHAGDETCGGSRI